MTTPARVLALGSVAVLVLLSACGGKPSAPATPTASATGEPSATATASVTASPTATTTPAGPGGIPIREWTLLPPQPMPGALALIIEKGSWGRPGPTGYLERVYRDASGMVRVEEVFRAPAGSSIDSTAFTGDFTEMAAMVCVSAGTCGGTLPPAPEARSTLVHSTDGGVTWSEVHAFEEPLGLAGIIATGYVLSRPSLAGDVPPSALLRYPGGQLMEPPAGAEDPLRVFSYDRRLLWRDANKTGFLTSDGLVALSTTLTGLTDPQYGVGWLGGNPATGTMLVTPIRPGSDPRQVVAVYREGKLAALWRTPIAYATLVNFRAWFNDHTAVANVTIAYQDLRAAILAKEPDYPMTGGQFLGYPFSFPALVDINTGEVTPIETYGPLSAPYEWSSNYVVAVQRGSFARVVLGAGECLNLRDAPALTGRILACVAGGTLYTFRTRQAETSPDGLQWLEVTTAAGLTGWASTSYLEY
ncbi:MAG: SH3 domain-containing protein [Chloroflexi bacterium]|nr:SH3 domain-containing protein [Chloroflexota bacterium]